jgi:hypothetical protein
MSRLVGRFYPEASAEGLALAADALSWAFVIDDIGDESPLGKDPKQLAVLLEAVERGMRQEGPVEPLGSALEDLDARVARICNPALHQDFREGVREFFDGLRWEASNRSRNRCPPLRAFVEMRPAAGAASMFVALLEILADYEVPRSWKASLEGRRIERSARNAMCWINDLLSVDKELRHGDTHNLVLVMAHEDGLSLEAATNRALAAYNAETRGFAELTQALAPGGSPHSFAAGLADMISGTRTWTMESARYRGGGDLVTT